MPPDEEKLKRNLYKCSCSDNGKHTNPDFHSSTCQYYFWYIFQDPSYLDKFIKGDNDNGQV